MRRTLQHLQKNEEEISHGFGIVVALETGINHHWYDLINKLFVDVKHNKTSRKTTVVCILVLCIAPLLMKAQQDSLTKAQLRSDTLYAINGDTNKIVPQKSLGDVIKNIFNIKSSPYKDSLKRTKNFNAAFIPALGYTINSHLIALMAGNITFKNKNDNNARLSYFHGTIAYTQKKQAYLYLKSSIWGKGNKYNFVGDWRVMHYPQDTYGLGGSTSIDSPVHMDFNYIRFYETVYREISKNFYAGIGYNIDYHWNISEERTIDDGKTDYEVYGARKKTYSAGPSISLLYDSRENPMNAHHGFYGNIIFRDNLKFFGSSDNWQSLIIDMRKYFPLPAKSRNVLAFWNLNWFVLNGHAPYLDLPSTGWDITNNTGRGYIQGRYRSNKMLYFETEYRFVLTRNGLLGAVVFVNAQSFSEWPENNFESIQPAAGAGLRIRLSKKSNTNVDFDYGFGTQGSRGLKITIAEIF